MIGAVFGKIGLKGLFTIILGISTESEMLDNVRNFVDLGSFSVAHASTKLNFRVHDAGIGNVDQQAFRARS